MQGLNPGHIPFLILILMPFITTGKIYASFNMRWYQALPSWTPNPLVISLVWLLIYITSGIAYRNIWRTWPRDTLFYLVIGLLTINTVANGIWVLLFFIYQNIWLALLDALFIACTISLATLLIMYRSFNNAALLFLYSGWAWFATFLTYKILYPTL